MRMRARLVGRCGRFGAEVGRGVLHQDGVAHVTHFRGTQVGSAVDVLTDTVGAKHPPAVTTVVLKTRQNLYIKYLHLHFIISHSPASLSFLLMARLFFKSKALLPKFTTFIYEFRQHHLRLKQMDVVVTFLLVTVKDALQLLHSSMSSSCCHLTSVSDDRIFSSWICTIQHAHVQ